ncbi:MAG: LCP family protein [Acidimicrobiales bacterium]
MEPDVGPEPPDSLPDPDTGSFFLIGADDEEPPPRRRRGGSTSPEESPGSRRFGRNRSSDRPAPPAPKGTDSRGGPDSTNGPPSDDGPPSESDDAAPGAGIRDPGRATRLSKRSSRGAGTKDRATVRRQRRRRRRRVLAVMAISNLAVIGIGGTYALLRNRLDQIQRITVDGLAPVVTGEPVNLLLVVTDGTGTSLVALLAADMGAGPSNVVGADARSTPVATGESLSDVYRQAGPSGLVEVLGPTLGAPIHHYVEVTVGQASAVVDAVDGVLVSDEMGTGCAQIDGLAAAELLRADPTTAVVRRQTDLVTGALAAGFAAHPLEEPARLRRLLSGGLAGVAFDRSLGNGDLGAISRAVQDPGTGVSAVPVVRLPASVPVAEPVVQIRVRVLNGTDTSGVASRTALELTAAGYAIAGTGDAPAPAAITSVRAAPGRQSDADALVANLVTAASAGEDLLLVDADLELIIGDDFDGLRPGAAAPVPEVEAPAVTEAPATVIRGCAQVG